MKTEGHSEALRGLEYHVEDLSLQFLRDVFFRALEADVGK